ncbi:MAG TPA: hypothetical protein VFP68_13815 [Burkholderiaceae bacterium]|nr:hypothetical protein [Burkholderiaceae bacterium]
MSGRIVNVSLTPPPPASGSSEEASGAARAQSSNSPATSQQAIHSSRRPVADASTAGRPRQPAPSPKGKEKLLERYDATSEAEKVTTTWRKAQEAFWKVSDVRLATQLLRRVLETARRSVATFDDEYARADAGNRLVLTAQKCDFQEKMDHVLSSISICLYWLPRDPEGDDHRAKILDECRERRQLLSEWIAIWDRAASLDLRPDWERQRPYFLASATTGLSENAFVLSSGGARQQLTDSDVSAAIKAFDFARLKLNDALQNLVAVQDGRLDSQAQDGYFDLSVRLLGNVQEAGRRIELALSSMTEQAEPAASQAKARLADATETLVSAFTEEVRLRKHLFTQSSRHSAIAGSPSQEASHRRYDPAAAVNELRTNWNYIKDAFPRARDLGVMVRLPRRGLEAVKEALDRHADEYRRANTRRKKDLLGKADQLDEAVYNICTDIQCLLKQINAFIYRNQAFLETNLRRPIAASYEIDKISNECKNLRIRAITNPLGTSVGDQHKLLRETGFDSAHVAASCAEQCFVLIGQEARPELPPRLQYALDGFVQIYNDLQNAIFAWETVLGLDIDPGKQSQLLGDCERQLDRMQAGCESFADAVMSVTDVLTPSARNAAMNISLAANVIVSQRTWIVDRQCVYMGLSESQSTDTDDSTDTKEATPSSETASASAGKEQQQASSKTKARSKSKRRFGKSTTQGAEGVATKSDADTSSELRTDIRKALKHTRVTLKKARDFGGNPIEIARSEGLPTLVVDYALQGTALAIENAVSNFVHDKFGKRKGLTDLLDKVTAALERTPTDAELQRSQEDLIDRLAALDEIDTWARHAQSDAVKTHNAPRKAHLEYLLDRGQIASVGLPRSLPSTLDPGDGRATLFEMVLQPTALSPLSEGATVQPLYIHLHTSAPVTENECHEMDFTEFSAVHVKTHADRGKGRGWVQLQREQALQAATSSNAEAVAPVVHRGRLDSVLLERLRKMASQTQGQVKATANKPSRPTRVLESASVSTRSEARSDAR